MMDKAETGMASGKYYKMKKQQRLLNTEASSIFTAVFEYMITALLRNINVAKSVIFPCFGVFLRLPQNRTAYVSNCKLALPAVGKIHFQFLIVKRFGPFFFFLFIRII